MPKWIGDNHYNNRVVVDYDSKTVSFKPVIGRFTTRRIKINLCLRVFTSSLYISVVIALLWILQFIGVWEAYHNYLTVLTAIFIIAVPSLTALLYYFKFLDSDWRKVKFPEANHFFISVLSIGSMNKSLVVFPENCNGSEIIIPRFCNVMIKWEAHGDFSDIKSISVKNHFFDKADEWFAVFKLNKNPVHGFLKIRYC